LQKKEEMNQPLAEELGSRARLYADAVDRMLERIDETAASIGEAFPLCADPATGAWQTSPDGRWTGGFWTGLLWLAFTASGRARHRDLAEASMRRLEVRLPIDNVLNGLVFYYGAAIGALLHASEAAARLGRQGAEAVAARFQPSIGFIPLGHQSGSLTGDANGETNIDGVPGMSLLFWAAEDLGEPSLREIGVRHMRAHVELCQRPDGSLHQAALVDPRSGAMLRQYSPRGYQHNGTWARAQSWGLLGFTQAYAWTREAVFVGAAARVADWWLGAVPADRIAFWDFQDPAIPATERDTSATAMAAGALLKLARLAPSEAQRTRYAEAGTAAVHELLEGYLTPTHEGDARPCGILTEGCWQRNEGMATRSELVWGDYYLLEALLLLSGRIDRVI
jgi:unsaturated chondroitin disaccharide hydrolase